jgi:hypothetical protein
LFSSEKKWIDILPFFTVLDIKKVLDIKFEGKLLKESCVNENWIEIGIII